MTGEPACPSCGSHARRPWRVAREAFGGNRFAIERCAGCGLGITAGDPPPAELLAFYDYGSLDAGRRFGLLGPWLRRLRASRVRFVAALLPQPDRALDVGCGDGSFLVGLGGLGWEVLGTEVDPRVAATAQERLGDRVVVGEIEALEAPARELGLVTFWHVLEHLPRPGEALARARERLRGGGLVVVEVPNLASWQARLGGQAWLHLDVPRHRYHFDPATLRQVALAAGLEPVSSRTPFSLDLGVYPGFQTVLAGLGLGAFLFTDVLRPGRPGWWRRPEGLLHLALAPLFALIAPIAIAAEAIAALAGRGGVVRAVFRRPPA